MADDPDETPALQPPNGIIPNFDAPSAARLDHDIIAVVCLVLCIFAVASRTFARAGIIKRFDTTDYALLWSMYMPGDLAKANISGMCHYPVFCILSIKMHKISAILYGPLMFPAKYALLRQIEAIFFQHQRDSSGRTALIALIWGNFLFYLGTTISFSCVCTPKEAVWNSSTQCIDTKAIMVASSVLNIISDLTALVLPLVVIWGIQIPFKSKIKVIAMFSIGIFANIASIIRLCYTLKLINSDDTTIADGPFYYWTHIEITTVMIAACAPVFPVLTRYLNDKYKQRSRLQTTDRRAETEHQRVSQDIYDRKSDRTKCVAPQSLKTLD
ncbi:hypothetical protein BJ166DRAFT_585009 [Pestalotiopsis sp. NC0098]|nr:hypothetical protein BJ166DRAFT_585009 [Pestalotiopsis sp. NC0098]